MDVATTSDERTARRLLRELAEREGGVTALAKRAHVSKSYISSLCSGSKSFGVAGRQSLEESLGLERGYFTGGSVAPGPHEIPVKTWDHAAAPAPAGAQLLGVAKAMSASAFALLVDNDAMVSPSMLERSIPPGVYVLIDPAETPAAGDDVLAQLEPTARPCLRRILEDGPSRYLRANNPTYGPMVKITDRVTILGRVMGIQANY